MRRLFESWREVEAFVVLLGVCIAGVVSITWWPAVPIGATLLFCMSAGQYQEYGERLGAIDGMWMPYETLVLSGLYTLHACTASFGLGIAVRWVWW